MKSERPFYFKPWFFAAVVGAIIVGSITFGFLTATEVEDGPSTTYFRGDMEMNGIHRDDVDYEPRWENDDEEDKVERDSGAE